MLVQVIEGTLSPDPTIRRAAEEHLAEASKQPSHPLEVLQLIAATNAASLPVQQAAAVHFKNLIKHGWDESKDEEDRRGIQISPQDRDTIKNHLVELMCKAPPIIRSQISESISLIAEADFPDKWNNLLPSLLEKLGSPDMAVVNGVLATANSIFKRFRHVQRSDELYRVLDYALKGFQHPLLAAFIQKGQAIQAMANDPQQLSLHFEALRLMCRIFLSLNFQDLPEFFEDHMGEWMAEFRKYLEYTNPVLVDESEEDEPSPIDKLQTAIIQNLSLYADKDEEPFLPFLPDFTSLVWNRLMTLTTYPKHDVLVTTSIKFLSSLIIKKMHNKLFEKEETLREIISKIVIPNLAIRESDEEKFEDDPQDYILAEIEGTDNESRRNCSRDLLKAMCQQFEGPTTSICMEHMKSMLELAATDASKWHAKDAAIHLMIGIAIRLESMQGVSELNPNVNLIEFFASQVFPELQDGNHDNHQMVKATALKFVCTFRKQFSKEQLVSLMPLLISHLNSPSVVVHTLSAYAIERNFMIKSKDAAGRGAYLITRETLTPLLESLFSGLFAIIDNSEWNENEHVMRCTMRALARAGDDVIPVTGIVFNRLATALERVCKNPRNPSYNHCLFESIAALVRNCCSKDSSKTSELEQLLFPPFQHVLQMDILEFTPYVFQILAQLLEYRPEGAGLGEAYTSLFPPLLTASLWEKKGNVPALVRLLQAYLKRAAADLIGHLEPILGIFQKINTARATEASASELIRAVTMFVPQANLQPYFKTIFSLMLAKLQARKSDRYPPLVVSYFALYAGLYGGQAFLDRMNEIQPGLGLQLLVNVWILHLPRSIPTKLEAKIQVVGLTRVLCDTNALLADNSGKQIWGQAFSGVVGILTSSKLGLTESTQEADAEVEIGYDATYTKLSFASKTPDDPFISTPNPVQSFLQSIQQQSAQQPGLLGPIIQACLGSDQKKAAGFQTLAQQAGINIA